MLAAIPYTAERRYAATPLLNQIIDHAQSIEGLQSDSDNYINDPRGDDPCITSLSPAVEDMIEEYRLKIISLNLRIIEMTGYQQEEMKD